MNAEECQDGVGMLQGAKQAGKAPGSSAICQPRDLHVSLCARCEAVFEPCINTVAINEPTAAASRDPLAPN